jgi:hypothetical protein
MECDHHPLAQTRAISSLHHTRQQQVDLKMYHRVDPLVTVLLVHKKKHCGLENREHLPADLNQQKCWIFLQIQRKPPLESQILDELVGIPISRYWNAMESHWTLKRRRSDRRGRDVSVDTESVRVRMASRGSQTESWISSIN